jgi:hypothetical protein
VDKVRLNLTELAGFEIDVADKCFLVNMNITGKLLMDYLMTPLENMSRSSN